MIRLRPSCAEASARKQGFAGQAWHYMDSAEVWHD